MTYFHGTQHPYRPDEAVVGGIVQGCAVSEDGEPTPDCDCGCDGRVRVWVSTGIETAFHAARNTPCGCPRSKDPDHVARVFEVSIEGPEEDPNAYTEDSVMAASGRILREVHAW